MVNIYPAPNFNYHVLRMRIECAQSCACNQFVAGLVFIYMLSRISIMNVYSVLYLGISSPSYCLRFLRIIQEVMMIIVLVSHLHHDA